MTTTFRTASMQVVIACSLCMFSGLGVAQSQEALPAKLQSLLKADKECSNYDTEFMKRSRMSAALGKTQTLYLLPCFSGAYNVVYRVYVLDTRYPDETRRSLFAGYSDETGWYGKDGLVNAEFDPKTKTLTAFEKGRGLGDCGAIPSYQWTGYGWRMTEYRYWGKCDGSRMPEQWPAIYRFKKPKN
ncbi:MAG: DUF1176 domain-containing protein [Pseudomonadota bacterium]